MSNRRYNGEPIDASWTSDLAEANGGKTVAASDDDGGGSVETDDWPSAVPKDAFKTDNSGLQADIIKHLVRFPDSTDTEVAQAVGCSAGHVNSVRGKVSLYAKPEDVPFDIHEIPTKSGLTENRLGDEKSRFDVDSWDELKPSIQVGERGSSEEVDVQDIGRRYYEHGESAESIASDYGVSKNVITGNLQGYEKGSGGSDPKGEPISEIGIPQGVFSENERVVFDYLLDNPESTYRQISSATGVSVSTVARTKHKAQCYVVPETLPFDVPEGPKKWAVTSQDWRKYQRNPPETKTASAEEHGDQTTLDNAEDHGMETGSQTPTVETSAHSDVAGNFQPRQSSSSNRLWIMALSVGALLGVVLQRVFGGESE